MQETQSTIDERPCIVGTAGKKGEEGSGARRYEGLREKDFQKNQNNKIKDGGGETEEKTNESLNLGRAAEKGRLDTTCRGIPPIYSQSNLRSQA